MNGRYVSEKPSRAFHTALVRPRRTCSTRSKSTSTDVYTCALVAFERTMCSAVRRRMLSNGTISSPAVLGAAPGSARRRRHGWSARSRLALHLRMRLRAAPARQAPWTVRRRGRRCGVIRPPSPVPVTPVRSTPRSGRASRRTIGDVTHPLPLPGSAAAGAATGAGAAAVRGLPARTSASDRCGLRQRRAACGRRAPPARAPAPSPRTARRTPTSTVSPSGTQDLGQRHRRPARAPRSRPCRSRPRRAARRRRRGRRPASASA